MVKIIYLNCMHYCISNYIRRKIGFIAFGLLLLVPVVNNSLFSQTANLQETIRTRVESGGIPLNLVVAGERLHARQLLPQFYENRSFQPAWSDDGKIRQEVFQLMAGIGNSTEEGLNPQDYHLDQLKELMGNKEISNALEVQDLAELDLLLTDSYLIYASHLLHGKVNPETIHSEWYANRRQASPVDILQDALKNNQVSQSFMRLLPQQPEYRMLKDALKTYRRILAIGGWTPISAGPSMKKGEIDDRIIELKGRLVASGDLDSSLLNFKQTFDDALENAVKFFQKRHGLEGDGVVGKETLAALNVSAESRVNQVITNLERWRWLPEDLGRNHILINIANFELDVIEDGNPVLIMKVIVGKNYRRTPVFSDKMTYLVFCPYWNVPQNIAVEDILPMIKKDTEYLTKQKMKVFQGWGSEAKEIDPATIEWSAVDGKNFNFRFRQDPWPGNALGSIKFMFPNRFNVYLHDTPAKELFKKSARGFSSGCIRLEKPLEFAEYLLKSDPKWSGKKIIEAINLNVERTVRLPESLPVHLLYWTAWVNKNGIVHFREDIYDRDEAVELALKERPPDNEN